MLYKAQGIYKGTGLYKGASIYDDDNISNDFIVCTYFKNTPVGEDLYSFSYNSDFLETTMTIDGIVYPAIRLNHFGSNINAGNTIPITDYDVVSLDFFIYPHISNFNDYVQLYGLRYFTRYTLDSGPSIKIGIDDNPGNPISFLGYVGNNNAIHMAFVYDIVNGVVTTYIDGIKKKTSSVSTVAPYAIVRCFGLNSSTYFDCTQWTLRKGDKSINGGDYFPVPTEPYFDF